MLCVSIRQFSPFIGPDVSIVVYHIGCVSDIHTIAEPLLLIGPPRVRILENNILIFWASLTMS